MIEVPGGHRADPGTPPFPGGVAVSHLRVYESTSVDGLAGGTPHGQWTLMIQDVQNGNSGTLQSWSLTLTPLLCPTTP